MPLARITKRSTEDKNYTIDYSSWLQVGDTISSVSVVSVPVTAPVLSANAAVATGAVSVVISLSGGLVDAVYGVTVQIFIDSSVGAPSQIKDDCLEVDIEDRC